MIKSGKRMAAAAIIAAAAAAAVPAGTASAATTGHHSPASPNTYGPFNNSVWNDGVTIRIGPGTGYAAAGYAHVLEILSDWCYTTGTTIYGNPYWDYILDASTGIGGYISEYYLTNQTQTKHC